ncbi:MAG: hypothetical protein ACOC7V_16435 [Spirochaetota bacterium]
MAVALIPLSADIAFVAASHHAALVAKDTRFEPGLQLLSEVRTGIGTSRDLKGSLRLQIDGGLALGAVGPSLPADGVVYRGLLTRGVWLSGGIVSSSGLGWSLGGRVTLASYEWTTLISLHTELELAAVLALPITDRLAVHWSLPLFYQFRRDLQHAFGIALRAGIRLEIRAPR